MDLLPELTVTLDAPITWGAKTVSEFTLREPTVGEMEIAWGFYGDGAPDKSMRFFLSLIGAQTGLSKQLLSLVPMNKYFIARKYLDDFTVPGPEIGAISDTP